MPYMTQEWAEQEQGQPTPYQQHLAMMQDMRRQAISVKGMLCCVGETIDLLERMCGKGGDACRG